MRYTTNAIGGLRAASREQLAAVLRHSKGTIAADDAAKALKVDRAAASRLLAGWATRGWLARVRRGVFVAVPLESSTADIALDDAWVVADKLFAPCYIGGWSAAQHWGFTEQLSRSILVFTTRRPRARSVEARGSVFIVRTLKERAMFGLKQVWRGKTRLQLSDPTRTMVDMLDTPALGGGIRSVIEMLGAYFASPHRDPKLLIRYADRLGNKAVFKRLGYIAAIHLEGPPEIVKACRARLSAGNAKLDPKLPAERLVTAWRLWVPAGFAKDAAR